MDSLFGILVLTKELLGEKIYCCFFDLPVSSLLFSDSSVILPAFCVNVFEDFSSLDALDPLAEGPYVPRAALDERELESAWLIS